MEYQGITDKALAIPPQLSYVHVTVMCSLKVSVGYPSCSDGSPLKHAPWKDTLSMTGKLKTRIEKLINKHKYLENNLTDGVWVVSADTLKFEYATPSLQTMSGYTQKEFLERNLRELLSPEAYRKTLSTLIEQRKRHERGELSVKTLELEMIHKEGMPCWIETTSKLLADDGGHLLMIGVIRDISQRKREEQEQQHLIHRLEEALAEKDRLLREVKVLKSLLPICSGCKRIRDEEGKWWPLDAYVTAKTNTDLSHTICGDCKDVFYD